jgi:hypothetical protein
MKGAASLLLAISSLALAADKHHWKAGRVLDSEAVNAYLQGASTTFSQPSAGASPQTPTQHMELKSSELLILGDEYAYVIEERVEKGEQEGTFYYDKFGRPIRNGKHGCSYVVNDWISYAQEGGNKLYVNDVHGKTCKLDIVRQARLQPKEIRALENPAAATDAPAHEGQPPSPPTTHF